MSERDLRRFGTVASSLDVIDLGDKFVEVGRGRFAAAVEDLLALPIKRVPVGPLMPRAFALRANVAATPATSRWLRRSIACC